MILSETMASMLSRCGHRSFSGGHPVIGAEAIGCPKASSAALMRNWVRDGFGSQSNCCRALRFGYLPAVMCQRDILLALSFGMRH